MRVNPPPTPLPIWEGALVAVGQGGSIPPSINRWECGPHLNSTDSPPRFGEGLGEGLASLALACIGGLNPPPSPLPAWEGALVAFGQDRLILHPTNRREYSPQFNSTGSPPLSGSGADRIKVRLKNLKEAKQK